MAQNNYTAMHSAVLQAALLLLLGTASVHSYLLTRERRATCSPGDCNNGGVCNNYTASPPCICPLPYISPYCSAAPNYCSTLQLEKGITELPVCQRGGNCTMTITDPYFSCSCPTGHTGIRCNETETASTNSSSDVDVSTTAAPTVAARCFYGCSPALSSTSTIAISVCVPLVLILIVVVLIYLCVCERPKAHDTLCIAPRTSCCICTAVDGPQGETEADGHHRNLDRGHDRQRNLDGQKRKAGYQDMRDDRG